MLRARAIAECVRIACPEVLHGAIYTAEELGARVDDAGLPVDAEVQQLRRVEPGQPDQWTTAAPEMDGEFEPHAEAQALAQRASEAKTRDEVNAVAEEAKNMVPSDARIKALDTGKPDALRDYLARCWKALPEAAALSGGRQDDGVPDVEVVAEGETEADIAERELRDAAANAGLTNLDEEFEQSYGLPIREAGAQQMRQMTAILTGSAA
jgi:hypothetical protein